jgi:hypothetical protein
MQSLVIDLIGVFSLPGGNSDARARFPQTGTEIGRVLELLSHCLRACLEMAYAPNMPIIMGT